jgi:predicted enzyme related to lactoylglutathione lyase
MTDGTSGYPSGAPCWYDLTVTDLAAAKSFYGGLLGWEFEESEWGYDKAFIDGRAVAALGSGQPEGPPAWTTYLATADIDGTARAVDAAGGKVVRAPHEAPSGRLAVLAEPAGGYFAAWQGESFFGCEITGVPGAPCWAEASSRQPKVTAEFFGTVFGLRVERPYRGYTFSQLSAGDQTVAGVLGYTHERRPTKKQASWLVYFQVPDTDAAVRTAEATGATVRERPEDTAFGRLAVLADPWGARFAVITRP